MIRPELHVYQTSTHIIQNNGDAPEGTPIVFNVVVIDNLRVFQPNTPIRNTEYVPNVPGWYECEGLVAFTNDSIAGARAAQFRRNGGRVNTAPYGAGNPPPSGSQGYVTSFAPAFGIISCNGINDAISLRGFQNTTINLSTYSFPGGTHSFMKIKWVAPL